jgi:hypothetical protein
MPWRKRTGLAKAAAILATILLVSLGLCGINFVALTNMSGIGVSNAHYGIATSLSTFFLILGVVEYVAIVFSALALVVVTLLWLIRTIWKKLKKQSNNK